MEELFDVCVVGAGMVGSAAAKWLSMTEGLKVCLIGPQEPTQEEWQSKERQIFGSHYDEGRLTREMDEAYTWAVLAQRSIARYREIERQSGISLYQEVGMLFVDEAGRESLRVTMDNAEKMGVDSYEVLGPEGVHEKFPFLHAQSGWQFLWHFKNAGHISPRKLVAAQQNIAAANGCRVIPEVVVAVHRAAASAGSSGDDDPVTRITSETGRVVCARRVLLCTGAFTNYHHLLPENRKIEFFPRKTFVLKTEVSEADAQKMSTMPSVMSKLPGKHYYLLPPIKYPDGKYYLKIGPLLTTPVDNSAMDLEAMAAWFRSEGRHSEWKGVMLDILKDLIPDLKPVSMLTSCCVSSGTPTDQLYCDMVTPHLGVLAAMTGRGAKSSDEIGRMGAAMISKGSWDHDLPAHFFKLRYKDVPNKPVSSKV